MNHPDLLILYVADVKRSQSFYQSLFDKEPIESSESFAMFMLETGLKFGLWAREVANKSSRLQSCQRKRLSRRKCEGM